MHTDKRHILQLKLCGGTKCIDICWQGACADVVHYRMSEVEDGICIYSECEYSRVGNKKVERVC